MTYEQQITNRNIKETKRWSKRGGQERRRDDMMRFLITSACSASLLCFLLLLCGLLGDWLFTICPSVCSYSRGNRVVDCSSRGLPKIPPDLQLNIHFLNLSFNSLLGLDSQLSRYAHLQTLDLSYNSLENLRPLLPRPLWVMRAAGNHVRSLEKNDTAYHWNLKVLDFSNNELDRVVFINNTLPIRQALNLSHNRFLTVPINMPHNLESIDLSHNYLLQILPGSLDRLPRLTQLYLHAYRFSWLSEGVFEKLTGLEMMSLGDNPWACEEEENIMRLLIWAKQTRATVFGCPCYTTPICGQTHLATPGKEWHSALFTEPPLWVDGRGEGQLPARTEKVTSSHQAKSALFETVIYQDKIRVNKSGDQMVFVWTSSTSFNSFSTYTSTTAHPLSSKKKTPNNSHNKGHSPRVKTQLTVTLTIIVMTSTSHTF